MNYVQEFLSVSLILSIFATMNVTRNCLQKLKNDYVGAFLVLSSFLYHAIIGIQGFDMNDEGWSLTGHQQIFNDPESVEYLFLYYLSYVTGGIWNFLFGWGGIYSFRLMTTVTLTLIAWIVWRMLRPYYSAWSIVAGIWMSFLCSYYGIMVFYHNYLTALFAVCAAATLFKALQTDNCRWAAVCGFILACNIFSRLPNICLTALVITLIPYYIYHRNFIQTMRHLVSTIGGFIIGILSVWLLMVSLGHDEIFVHAVSSGLSATSSPDSTHNMGEMINTYLSVYKTVFTLGYFNNTYTVYLLSTLGWFWVVFSRRYRHEDVYLSTIAVVMLHTIPLGSDFGIENTGENCVYLAAPVLTGIIWQSICTWSKDCNVSKLCRISFIVFLCLFYLRGLKQVAGNAYFDPGWRTAKTWRIDNPLATTYTTERNVKLANPMFRELAKYVKEDDYLLCFQNTPTIHFLTKTRPYLYNPWVWTYDSSNMEQQFLRAERNHNKLPVIVRDKSQTTTWYEFDPDWNNAYAKNTYFHKNKKILLIQEFIKKHCYKVVWENEVLQILIPEKG